LDLRRVQSGEPGLILLQQAPTAAYAALRHHRHARAAQHVHIPQDRARGDFQALGQIARGHPPLDLQHQKDGKQTIAAHRETLSAKYDNRCHELPSTLLA